MPLDILTLSDPSGSKAHILPGLGFNCFSFSAVTASGPLEVLWAAPDITQGTAKPSGSGIPLMFPFAGRIRGTSFSYEGKTYALEAGDGIGNAIHGFVIHRPWRVTHASASRATGQFQASVDDPKLLSHWPADFRITADYSLAGNQLITEYTIENPDNKPLPFGFGTHPYFRVPLQGSQGAECVVTVPVGEQWELTALLPTGQRSAPRFVAELAQGMPMSAMKFDHVFAGLKFDNHRTTTSVFDPGSKRRLTMTFDDQFPVCVVYNPPHREAVCIEPYTTVPDPFTLRQRNLDPHLQVLAPGKSFRTKIDITLS